MSALARGARKSQKRFGGGLGLCSVGEAGLRERSGAELLTLERFDLHESHGSFATDIARMAHAAYVAELVSKLCAPRQVELEVYDWLLAFLGALDRHGASAERLRVFELGLLGRLGFGPMVETCAVCGGAQHAATGGDDEVAYRWDPDRGGAVCGACGRRGRPIRAVVRRALARLAAEPGRRAARSSRCPPTSTAAAATRSSRSSSFTSMVRCISLDFIAKMGGHV